MKDVSVPLNVFGTSGGRIHYFPRYFVTLWNDSMISRVVKRSGFHFCVKVIIYCTIFSIVVVVFFYSRCLVTFIVLFLSL